VWFQVLSLPLVLINPLSWQAAFDLSSWQEKQKGYPLQDHHWIYRGLSFLGRPLSLKLMMVKRWGSSWIPDETYAGFSVVFNPPAAQAEGEKPVDLPAAVPVQVKAVQIFR
jgi:hypothetical protein